MLTEEIVEGYKYPDWDKGLYWLVKYRKFPEISNSLKNLKKLLVIYGVNDKIVSLSSDLDLINIK